jgi:hypothetical protein
MLNSFDSEITGFRNAGLLVRCATLGFDLLRFMSSALVCIIGMVIKES